LVVLVTGGSGFIGNHLVEELIRNDHKVRVFDIRKPQNNENVEWINGDILNQDDLNKAGRDVETIFHLCAIADVNVALTDPIQCVKVNEIGTINLLNMARALEIERVILASSTWVYGKQETVTEESPVPEPDHIYTKTKIGQEHLIRSWNKTYGVPYTILRYGIPYGPMMRSNLVLSIFVRRAKENQPITIFGDGNQGRCFIYVKDLAEGNVTSMVDAGKNEIFNLAGSQFVTIKDIVNELSNKFKNLKIEYGPARPGDFKGVNVKIDKAKLKLKWEPKTEFIKGVDKYLKSIA